MTDKEIIEDDQDVELHDEVTDEIVEQQELAPKGKGKAHDPDNAPAQAAAAASAAADATKKTSAPGGDKPAEPMPKTKAGMINAMYGKMNAMKKDELQAQYKKMMSQNELMPDDMKKEMMKHGKKMKEDISYAADFEQDLEALVNEEATLSDEFKVKAETIFEAAIKSKLSEEIDRLEARYEEELAEEVKTTKEDLVEKVDSYLNYVVEQWMEDNKVEVQNGLRTEIAEKFMNNLKDLFTESYIEVPESKVDLVDELAGEVEELEEKLNDQTGKAIAMAEELEAYKREAIIREASKDLAETQVEKLKTLVADVDFDDEEVFTEKVNTVKESYFSKAAKATDEEIDEEGAFEVDASDSMSQYLNAIKRTSK